MTKQLQKINETLEKLLEEKDIFKRKRNENREKAKQFFSKSKIARQHRDEVNEKIQALKAERSIYFKERDAKQAEKKDLIKRLEASDDNAEKKQLYQQLLVVKEELKECRAKADAAHQAVQDLAHQSQEYHLEMKTYIQLGKQAHGIADELHPKVVNISKTIMKTFKERDKLQNQG